MLPEINDPATRAATWTTAASVVLAIVWRVYLWVRRDSRIDAAGQSTSDVYKDIIAQLEAHIARLEARLSAAEARANVLDEHLKAAGIRINDEVNARYLAESKLRRVESELLGAQSLAESLRVQLNAAQGAP